VPFGPAPRPAHAPAGTRAARTGALVRTLSRWTWTRGRRLAIDQFGAPAIAWSDPSGSRLLVLQPRDGVNRLGVLTGGRVVLAGNDLLPAAPKPTLACRPRYPTSPASRPT
jgi:hypothetical protein